MKRLAALALLACFGCAHAAAPEVGSTAPPFSAQLLDGTRFSLPAGHDRVVLINFWATWCEPCQAELAAFAAYMRAHPQAPLTIIAVSMDDPERRAQVAQVAAKLPFAVAIADNVKAERYGRIWRLPMSFVVDRAGVLRVDGGRGEQVPFDLPTLERTITPLLQNE
ncbi:MAG TPA: TlpA disulfide reductase family protein [Nevskiaceae bacterium]|nr:TlpA disulfide reductase family protein [Nevskiaceae bacterium]